jgi:hypothetical protein
MCARDLLARYLDLFAVGEAERDPLVRRFAPDPDQLPLEPLRTAGQRTLPVESDLLTR